MSLFALSHLSLTPEHIFFVLELQLVIRAATVLALSLRFVLARAQGNESVTLEVIIFPLDSERIVAAVMDLSEQEVIGRVFTLGTALHFELVLTALAHQQPMRIKLGLTVKQFGFTGNRRLVLSRAPAALEMVTIIVGTCPVIFHDVPLVGTDAALVCIEGPFVGV